LSRKSLGELRSPGQAKACPTEELPTPLKPTKPATYSYLSVRADPKGQSECRGSANARALAQHPQAETDVLE
jgi:hypothetical protein